MLIILRTHFAFIQIGLPTKEIDEKFDYWRDNPEYSVFVKGGSIVLSHMLTATPLVNLL
jgi:hypothetical protein